MRKSLIVLAVALATGCSPTPAPVDPNGVDQCLRREIFLDCMAALPSGPQRTEYNDWSEVVDECGEQAFYQSKRLKEQIPAECRVH